MGEPYSLILKEEYKMSNFKSNKLSADIVVSSNAIVCCVHCGSSAWTKKGYNKAGTERVLLCKDCGRRFAGPLDLSGDPTKTAPTPNTAASPSKTVQGGQDAAATESSSRILIEVNGRTMECPCSIEQYKEIARQMGNTVTEVTPTLYRVSFPTQATKG